MNSCKQDDRLRSRVVRRISREDSTVRIADQHLGHRERAILFPAARACRRRRRRGAPSSRKPRPLQHLSTRALELVPPRCWYYPATLARSERAGLHVCHVGKRAFSLEVVEALVQTTSRRFAAISFLDTPEPRHLDPYHALTQPSSMSESGKSKPEVRTGCLFASDSRNNVDLPDQLARTRPNCSMGTRWNEK